MKQKLLALLLALACALPLASPALAAESTPYFTDEKDITHLEAVTGLVRLGVMSGKEDGSYFDPKGTVTRGEAAKMMAAILTGGKDLTSSTNVRSAFPDIGGHWAEPYIQFCAEKGVAFPQDDSNFGPNGTATYFELLRMAEVALGEDPNQYAKATYWILMTHAVALNYGLLTELDNFIDKPIADHPLTRDEAAQILYNALNATPKAIGSTGFYEDVRRPDGTPSTLLRESFGYDSWDNVPALPAISAQETPQARPVSAADPTAFTDAKDIAYWQAVASLAKLGVVSGRDDGAFHPAEGVTRAEAAKLIFVMMQGGRDINIGTKEEPAFSDIQGHWAEGYIEYCADMGIVNGRGDGSFDPEGSVTGLEFCKMALTALGYDPKSFDLVGERWAANTLERACHTDGRKLVEGLDDIVLNHPASRDTAAQLLYNTLLATPMMVVPDGRNDDGTVIWNFQLSSSFDTLLRQRFDLKEFPAVPSQPKA